MERDSRNPLVWIIIGIILTVLVAAAAWETLNLRAVDHDSTETKTFILDPGMGANDVADKLYENDLIRNPTAFKIYITISALRSKLQAGNYDLSPSQSAMEIAGDLADGRVAANRVVIPDGANILQLRKLFELRGVSTDDFDTAMKGSYTNDFLKARPQGASLEGYLFPDSYEIVKPLNVNTLIQSVLNNFAQKINGTDIVKSYSAQGLTLHQGVTLASIVEKEVSSEEDRAMVAQVYINRIKKGMKLEADPTVHYAADITGKPFSVNLDSPYNTYKYAFPPGPICNPSLSSMKAVAHPKPNDYLYFIADKQGKTHYAKTYEEHQKNVQTYLK